MLQRARDDMGWVLGARLLIRHAALMCRAPPSPLRGEGL